MPVRYRRVWKRLVSLVKPIFASEARGKAILGLVIIAAALLGVKGLDIAINYAIGDFMTAIEKQDWVGFGRAALELIGAFVAITTAAVTLRYAEERSGLFWREWLTRELVKRYLADRSYRRLRGHAEVDNPDQRIAEDAKTFTQTALALLVVFSGAALTVILFSPVIWKISPWLLLAAVCYAALGSTMALAVGRRLPDLHKAQLQREADFRYGLVRVRDQADVVALQETELAEGRLLGRRLQSLAENFRRLINVNRSLGLFTNGYNYMMQVVPVLVVAPLYFRGEVEFGVVIRSQAAFALMTNSLSTIVTEFNRLSSFAAVTERLAGVWEATAPDPIPDSDGPVVDYVPGCDRISLERLTLTTPPGEKTPARTLVRELNLKVQRGRRVLVLGPSGSGKTTLVRALAGMWEHGSGRVVRPGVGEVAFLPPRPHHPQGKLRDLLLYTHKGGPHLDDKRLLTALADVGFDSRAAGGLDAEHDWDNYLSAGEKEELAVARVLLTAPPFAVLDDATSALDPHEADRLYRLLARSGVTYISVSNRPGLAEFHDTVLELRGDGDWKLREMARAG